MATHSDNFLYASSSASFSSPQITSMGSAGGGTSVFMLQRENGRAHNEDMFHHVDIIILPQRTGTRSPERTLDDSRDELRYHPATIGRYTWVHVAQEWRDRNNGRFASVKLVLELCEHGLKPPPAGGVISEPLPFKREASMVDNVKIPPFPSRGTQSSSSSSVASPPDYAGFGTSGKKAIADWVDYMADSAEVVAKVA
jgi:hypothetical protein